MKKLATLFLAAGMVFAASAPASAVDIKVNGEYHFTYQTGSTYTGDKTATDNNYSGAQQRVRLGIAAVASENLSGYFQIQEDDNWGVMDSNHGNKTKLSVRQAYIDWTIPGTDAKVRMGRQLLGLPGDAFGQNLVMHGGFGQHDAIAISTPVTDWLSATAFWTRGWSNAKNTLDEQLTSDAYGIVAKIKVKGLTVEPWAMYAVSDAIPEATITAAQAPEAWGGGVMAGYDAQIAGETLWLGATATMTYFDPFKIVASFAWSDKQMAGVEDRQGWYATAKASYTTGFGVPFVAGWYGSGDDKGDQNAKQGWINSYGGRTRPTAGMHANTAGLANDPNAAIYVAGSWGAGIGIEKVSFLKDLSHTFQAYYVEGTNSKDAPGAAATSWKYMTEEDSTIVIEAISTYNIYKNMSAVFDLSYMINDFEKDNVAKGVEEDAWRAMLHFQYKF